MKYIRPGQIRSYGYFLDYYNLLIQRCCQFSAPSSNSNAAKFVVLQVTSTPNRPFMSESVDMRRKMAKYLSNIYMRLHRCHLTILTGQGVA
jgi:hypothetical protein